MSNQRPYYEAMGQGCDDLLRCKDCRQLVTAATLASLGRCPCGCSHVTEIRTLSESEMHDISTGVIDFPHRDLFLKEFGPWQESS